MDQINQIVNSYRIGNYGNLIKSDPVYLDQTGKEWIAILKSNYPRFIVDDNDPPSRELYFITLDNLGSIRLNEEGKLLQATPREIVVNRIDDYLTIWKNRVETAIIKACSNELVFSPTIKYFLNPLRRIISTVLLAGIITHQEIKWLNTDSAYQWIHLLLTSKILDEYENGYKYGDMWSEFYKKATMISNNEDKEYYEIFIKNMPSFNRNSIFEHLIMAYMLEENFTYIQDIMNITQINAVINMNNAFYKPCIESQKLLIFRPQTIVSYYNRNYPDQKLALLSSAIMELVSIGLLYLRDGKLYGDETRFKKMMKLHPSKQISLPA